MVVVILVKFGDDFGFGSRLLVRLSGLKLREKERECNNGGKMDGQS